MWWSGWGGLGDKTKEPRKLSPLLRQKLTGCAMWIRSRGAFSVLRMILLCMHSKYWMSVSYFCLRVKRGMGCQLIIHHSSAWCGVFLCLGLCLCLFSLVRQYFFLSPCVDSILHRHLCLISLFPLSPLVSRPDRKLLPRISPCVSGRDIMPLSCRSQDV